VGRVNIVPPQANFKTLVNKNAIKPEDPRQFFLKALTPLEILAKNIRYPLPRIVNPYASMVSAEILISVVRYPGGPLLYHDRRMEHFVQIAVVEGGVRDCGDDEYPGIYVRLDHPSVLDFITAEIADKPSSTEPIKETNEEDESEGKSSF
jgi:hypothetical protein